MARAIEEVSEIKTFPVHLFTASQYEDILKFWIYPRIDGIQVHFWALASDETKGIASIFIPPQSADRKPFLVIRTVAGDGKKSETVFGHFERRRSAIDHMTVERLHSLLQAGMQFHRVSVQLNSMQDQLQELVARVDQQQVRLFAAREEKVQDRVSQAIEAVELGEIPTYVLSMRPLVRTDVPTLSRSSSEPVVQLLDDPSQLLNIGFHLKSTALKSHVEGQRRRAMQAQDELLELWRGGVLIAVMRADPAFLCWASKSEGMTINPYVLIDSVCEFVELTKAVCKHMQPQVSEVEFSMLLKGMIQGQPSHLGTVLHRSLLPRGFAPANDFETRQPANLDNESIGAIAYKMVAAVFRWYDLAEYSIPWVEIGPNDIRLESIDLSKVTAPR